MRQNIGVIIDCLRANAEEFRKRTQELFTRARPETLLLFPTPAHSSLVDAVCYLIKRAPFDEKTVAVLRQLAAEHLRFGARPEHYEIFAQAMCRALQSIARDTVPPEEIIETEAIFTEAAEIMATAAREAEAGGERITYEGRVVATQQRSRDIYVVRLEAEPIPFTAGQYLPVTMPLLQGHWRFLSPALPPNRYGHMEFHVRATDECSRTLAKARIGDEWMFGTPLGKMHVDYQRDILMIAHTTGLAPMRAILLELAARQGQPRVHLFFGAEYPGELYDLLDLWNIAGTAPWLSVIPVSTHPTDSWFVGATKFSQPPRGLHLRQTGKLGEVVTSYGTWDDRDILIAGPPKEVQSIKDTMIQAGTPESIIQHDPL
ncbi:oxidoreductase [Corynebacterium canis]|uniref:Oxidoreductase n=2 Tax=Corynebacterium canis TaxID=679663 RepID=A0A5C5TVV8_9CORY|nr:oxidoreductase [Corynebacterium canis]WJY76344.1 Phenol hydroxylase P5 protein [Corynebacterium canis]